MKHTPEEPEENSDNDVVYENYKPKIEPKAIKIREHTEKRRGSIVSIQSRHVSKLKKKISKKQFESDSEEEDENFESISRECSGSSEEEEKQ